ncbi:MAG: hypothetical protein KGL53_16305 [Elusimicrobia bacterium]|nr:hypothetical protein [Elusimicrobiota bacterium]
MAGLLASGDAETAGWWDRALLRLHLAMCSHCSRFARQLSALGAAFRAAWAPRAGRDAEELRRRILERLRGR